MKPYMGFVEDSHDILFEMALLIINHTLLLLCFPEACIYITIFCQFMNILCDTNEKV